MLLSDLALCFSLNTQLYIWHVNNMSYTMWSFTISVIFSVSSSVFLPKCISIFGSLFFLAQFKHDTNSIHNGSSFSTGWSLNTKSLSITSSECPLWEVKSRDKYDCGLKNPYFTKFFSLTRLAFKSATYPLQNATYHSLYPHFLKIHWCRRRQLKQPLT